MKDILPILAAVLILSGCTSTITYVSAPVKVTVKGSGNTVETTKTTANDIQGDASPDNDIQGNEVDLPIPGL